MQRSDMIARGVIRLNARAAPEVARLMARELDWTEARQASEVAPFSALAKGYQLAGKG